MKKLSGLDKYVIFSISVLLVYAVAEFIVSTVTGISHDQLSAVIFGFFGAPEIIACALIKIFKLREENKECDWREHGHDNDIADSSVDSADL